MFFIIELALYQNAGNIKICISANNWALALHETETDS